MRLGCFTMPLHPAHRAPAQTLQEDREAVILADKLGFYDAFDGEHLTEKSENVTNSFIFLATLPLLLVHARQEDAVLEPLHRRVVDQILALNEQAGEFGEIVYAGIGRIQSRKGTQPCTAP